GHQVHDLALHRDIERRGRLIGDQELRLARDRHRDHHALLLAAGKLERIGLEPRLWLRDAYFREQLDGAAAQRAAGEPEMLAQHLADLEADREDRVERRHRLLEDHADLLAAHALHLIAPYREEVAAAIENAARGCDGRVFLRQQAH